MSLDVQRFGKSLNELLVLGTLRAGPKHGYQIALDVEEESGGTFELQHGTLYPILHRLEKEGLIRGRWTEDGRRRKVYELTRDGRRQLDERSSRVRDVFDALLTLIGERNGGTVRGSAAAG